MRTHELLDIIILYTNKRIKMMSGIIMLTCLRIYQYINVKGSTYFRVYSNENRRSLSSTYEVCLKVNTMYTCVEHKIIYSYRLNKIIYAIKCIR